jgi:hypothetical protein
MPEWLNSGDQKWAFDRELRDGRNGQWWTGQTAGFEIRFG